VRHDFVDVFGTAMVHLIVVRDRCYQVERLAVRSEEGRVLKASSLVLYLGDWDSSFSLERNRGNVGIYKTGFTGILLNGESEGMLVIELRIEPINGSHDQTFLFTDGAVPHRHRLALDFLHMIRNRQWYER
jgi:hypothetical protein